MQGRTNERRAIRLDSTVQIYNRKRGLSSILTIIFTLGLNFLLRLLTLSLCHIVTGVGYVTSDMTRVTSVRLCLACAIVCRLADYSAISRKPIPKFSNLPIFLTA